MFQQTDASLVKLHEDVNIAQWRLIASGIRSEQPCTLNGLGLEVVGYRLLHHLCTHKRIVLESSDKDTKSLRKMLTLPYIL
jgi:hypothetical protein